MELANISVEERLAAAVNAGRINTISKLKNFPNLDASLMRFIIGPINVNTKIENYSPADVSVCKDNNCSIWQSVESINNLPDDLKDEDPNSILSEEVMINDCLRKCEKCPYNNILVTTTYINPKKRYNLYNMDRSLLDKPNIKFSKLLIKIMIVLQCWPAEIIEKSGKNDGTLPSVYIPDLANILDCNINFLEDCLCNLGNLGLISLNKLSPHLYDITIPDYYLKFKKASQGSGGYIQIDREILMQLLKENSITALRGMILQLLSNPFAYNTDKPKSVSESELRSIMPSYVCYQAQYDKALKNNVFTSVYDKRSKQFIFMPRKEYKSVTGQKTRLMSDNVRYISGYLHRFKPSFVTDENTMELDSPYRNTISRILIDKKDNVPNKVMSNKPLFSFLKDAIGVSIEYGWEIVVEAIKKIEYNYRVFGTEIKNAGAMLRTYCCYNFINGVT